MSFFLSMRMVRQNSHTHTQTLYDDMVEQTNTMMLVYSTTSILYPFSFAFSFFPFNRFSIRNIHTFMDKNIVTSD